MGNIRNEQELILDVMEAFQENGEPKLKRAKIKSEVMKTSLSAIDKEKHADGRGSKLDHIIDQALYQLKKKGKIIRTVSGEWKLAKIKSDKNKGREMYRPKPCAAIIKKSGGDYCRVRNVFIGSPTEQCELLHGSDPRKISYSEEGKPVKQSGVDTYPMKPCYFTKSPTEPQIQVARNRLQSFEERQRRMAIPRVHGF